MTQAPHHRWLESIKIRSWLARSSNIARRLVGSFILLTRSAAEVASPVIRLVRDSPRLAGDQPTGSVGKCPRTHHERCAHARSLEQEATPLLGQRSSSSSHLSGIVSLEACSRQCNRPRLHFRQPRTANGQRLHPNRWGRFGGAMGASHDVWWCAIHPAPSWR